MIKINIMSSFLDGYKEYYRLRMQRYENLPGYTRSHASEKAIYEVIASCSTLEEFKERLGNLNHKNAVALVMDEYEIRLKHYESMNETVKAEGCRRILERVKDMEDVTQLVTAINEENNRLNIEITTDSIYPFTEPVFLEQHEIWMTAEVPDKYRKQYDVYAADEQQRLKDAYRSATQAMQNYQPGWAFNVDRVLEERHLRLLPISQNAVQEQIALTKKLLQ